MRDLSLHVMDIAQNSISAGATWIAVTVEEDRSKHTMKIAIEDNGCGMSEEQLKRVQSPFYTTRATRSVGLGIPLFKMICEMTGGRFSICSQPGVGTAVQVRLITNHIDMLPLGDICQTILLLITCNPDVDFVYRHQRDGRQYTLDTGELRKALGGEVALNSPDVTAWIRDHLAEQEEKLDWKSNRCSGKN